MTEKLDKLRREVEELIDRDKNNFMMKSCWNCNPSHEYLKEVKDYVIICFECRHFYFKGVDITQIN